MKRSQIIFAIPIFLMVACSGNGAGNDALEARLHSLENRLDSTYKPGLGEFMSGIQVHHAKLWFAGEAQNWSLADFEINEIKESVEDINRYCRDRPEIQSLPMIGPAIDSVSLAVKYQNIDRFKQDFLVLTNTCNSCHRATKHAFNVIQVPDKPPFTNQSFSKQKN
jgi:hypothetical protein